MTTVSTTDYHTAGEPFRIVTGGVTTPPGDTVPARRQWAMEHLDDIRGLLCREPRGHADMYGCFVTPGDDDSDLGAVFFHNDGFSTACGHGTIALATWAIDTGLVTGRGHEALVTIDVPSGRVHAAATLEDGRAVAVRFRNVAASVHTLDADLRVDGRQVRLDVAYGGAFYATLDAGALGCSVTAQDLPRLIALGRAIKQAADEQLDLALPDDSGDKGLYGVVFHETRGIHHQRNVTVFGDGQVDRSPCGSATSARLALLVERGEIGVGETFVHESIVGTQFLARVTAETVPLGGVRRWETEVQGRASRTGQHTFVLEHGDELPTGFLLR